MLAVSVALLAITAVGGTALAGHLASEVKSYTGCLVTSSGTLVKIKEGDTPAAACTSGQVQVHFSGGDITTISVTGGLTGGGSNGEVTIGLDPKYSLPQGCSGATNVAKFDGTAWVCAMDNDTHYFAGTGLDLNGSSFSIEPGYRVPGKSCGTAGHFARGFDSNGDIQCSAPAANGLEVWQKARAYPAVTVVRLPKGEGVDVLIMPLPAGTFLLTAVAELESESGDDELHVTCFLRNGAFSPLPVHNSTVDIGDGSNHPRSTAVVHGVVTLASADNVRFTCSSHFGDGDPDQVWGATVTAVKVGTVHTP
ncbi:MAG: hypothetical protein ICV64_06595 [Thermoleophilia bacterium]|nr:hypothetical protein [Thermoleophilia bacterium]